VEAQATPQLLQGLQEQEVKATQEVTARDLGSQAAAAAEGPMVTVLPAARELVAQERLPASPDRQFLMRVGAEVAQI
jgi:hypothetical protein